jgi:phospholipase/carboxylesterase
VALAACAILCVEPRSLLASPERRRQAAVDSRGASPEALEELERRALAAMQAGRWEKGEELLEHLVARAPGHPRAQYNLACCRSRLGDLRGAEQALEAAWRGGMQDVDRMRADPDLAALRASRRGAQLLERLEAEQARIERRRGALLLFDAPVAASARVVTPVEIEAERRYPLVVVLHGHGASAEPMAGIFLAAGLSPELIVCAPAGPHPVWRQDGQGRSWYPPVALYDEARKSAEPAAAERRRLEIDRLEQGAANCYVLAAMDAVIREYPVDAKRIFLMGHSEGGVLAYGLALTHPERFRGVVAIGARLRSADADGERLERAAGLLSFLVCHSPDDDAIDLSHAEEAHGTLRAAGIESRLHRYGGGHGLTVDLIRSIASWIERRCRE